MSERPNMPRTLVMVRHGESQGNEAARRERAGDLSGFTPEYRNTPSSTWGLTREGFAQARAAGLWIARFVLTSPHIPEEVFDKAYISPHTRSRQTMGGIALHAPVKGDGLTMRAQLDLRLREQDFGDISTMPKAEYKQRYADNALERRVNRLYWRPPGGESVADVVDRVRLFLGALSRARGRGMNSALVVSHGRQISATQIVLEGLDPHTWADYLKDNEIKNAQVVQYSRINPDTGQEASTFHWRRSVCPWETPDHPGEWREFQFAKTLTVGECLEGIPLEWRTDPPAGMPA